jgi:hypothetical protein
MATKERSRTLPAVALRILPVGSVAVEPEAVRMPPETLVRLAVLEASFVSVTALVASQGRPARPGS